MPRKSNPKAAYLAAMRQDMSPPSHIEAYLATMAKENPEGAEDLRQSLAKAFTTGDGLKALILLEKSVLYVGVPNGSPDGALREMNAVRNFVLEIRRLVAHG